MILAGLLLIAFAAIGAPLFAVIAAGAMYSFYRSDVDLSAIAIELYRLAEMPVLVAIPLFTFAGYLLGESQAPRRLVRLTNAVVGWIPGSLAVVALLTCAMFTAFTGASGVTIIAMGALLYPALSQAGYRENFNLGLITTSGSLGLLFAPSLPLILYGVIAQQLEVGRSISIDELFLAGLLPGILMLLMLGGYSLWKNRAIHQPIQEFSWREARAAVREAIWELPLPVIVLGGIYGGWLAVSEAAAMTAIYVLVVEMFIYREVSFSRLIHVMHESMVLVGGILIIVGVSLASTNALIDAQIPMQLFDFIKEKVSEPLTFLLLLNLFLLALGMMLDIFSALVIVVPLILPIAVGFGIDPVHLGIIFLANMQVGYFTPPVGMNLFIASYRFKKPVAQVFRATLPFFLILLLAVVIITYLPLLSLGLLER